MTVHILTEERNDTGGSTVLGVFATLDAGEQARARTIAVAHAGHLVVYGEDTEEDDWDVDYTLESFPVTEL